MPTCWRGRWCNHDSNVRGSKQGHRFYGIKVWASFRPENRKYLLENRLANRLKALGLKTFGEYYYYLRFDAGKREELKRLFEVITTNETSFFRNPPQLKVFQDIILKQLIEDLRSKRQKKIRI